MVGDKPITTVDEDDYASRSSRTAERDLLFLIVECSRPIAGGARIDVTDADEVVIVRGGARDLSRSVAGGKRRLTVAVADALVSSAHGRLVREGDEWRLEDTGSRNGSRVDGRAVTSATFREGALVEMGGAFFKLAPRVPMPVGPAVDLDFSEAARGPVGTATLLPVYQQRLGALAHVAAADVPVLLLGETGTGKELIAKAIHDLSRRAGDFVPVNCGALPQTLLEGQLFGHVRGAFSGATRDEPGFVRSAHGGTLFLDEVAELPRPSQATLLRVLQERAVTPVGATRALPVGIRIVSATHQPLAKLPLGAFRSDLYARLAGFTLRLPPLRERREDLGGVLSVVLHQLAGERASELRLTPNVTRAMLRHEWPHNARELYHAMSVAVVLSRSGTLDLPHFPDATRVAFEEALQRGAASSDGQEALAGRLTELLRETGGNVTEVARTMGHTRTQIHRWMKRFGIDPDSFRRA